jgi:hypothetical protein
MDHAGEPSPTTACGVFTNHHKSVFIKWAVTTDLSGQATQTTSTCSWELFHHKNKIAPRCIIAELAGAGRNLELLHIWRDLVEGEDAICAAL